MRSSFLYLEWDGRTVHNHFMYFGRLPFHIYTNGLLKKPSIKKRV